VLLVSATSWIGWCRVWLFYSKSVPCLAFFIEKSKKVENWSKNFAGALLSSRQLFIRKGAEFRAVFGFFH
jgi:hypothetical protein